jgi:hypothetical protein
MGSGFRTFTAGEVLTASNVQNYLMDQSVMVFGGSAARSSAIGTANFEEGMVSYLTDTDKVEAYNGTNWVSVAPTTSQGLTLINTTSFSGVASQAVNSVFSATYNYYRILMTLDFSTNTTNRTVTLRLRNGVTDVTTNYNNSSLGLDTGGGVQNETATSTSVVISKNNYFNGFKYFANLDIALPFATDYTNFFGTSNGYNSGSYIGFNINAMQASASSYNGINLICSSGNFSSSTIAIYGYNK